MADIKLLNPKELYRPRSPFTQVAHARASKLAFIAGQVSVGASGALVGENDFAAQCDCVYENIGKALLSVGAEWGNVVQFTSFLTRAGDIPAFGAYRERNFPKMFPKGAYPPNTLLIVGGLAHQSYLLEVQTIAAL